VIFGGLSSPKLASPKNPASNSDSVRSNHSRSYGKSTLKILAPAVPFSLGAPSMVYGEDLVENVKILSSRVTHIEIVLFDTFQTNNLPSAREIDRLSESGEQRKVTYSIHLPASLEPVSGDAGLREASLEKAIEIIQTCARLNPTHYVLHLPFSKPTLVPVPGLYFPWKPTPEWDRWEKRAWDSLQRIKKFTDGKVSLLIENINYSPQFLRPFLEDGTCGLCLDIGHLLLGREDVSRNLENFIKKTFEIHFHGVEGWQEHLSLARLPFDQIQTVVGFLQQRTFQGLLTLEVFDPQDLEESLSLVNLALI
jgi:sugar phosphate isomerase/epimerase